MSDELLLVYRRSSSFIAIDATALRRDWTVREWNGRRPVKPVATLRAVARAQVVLCWFAGWHSVLPVTFARLLRRPAVMIVGGVDTANLPEIGYGMQRTRGGRFATRWSMRLATRLITNSEFARRELEANVGIPASRATVVHHGVADPFGELPPPSETAEAITVGVVDRRNLGRKGLEPFVRAAAQLPDVRFTVAGRFDDDAGDHLRSIAPPNVELTGWLDQPALEDRLRRATVYVQASQHEGFGLSVVEAMLAGCIPVVTRAGALPEVVADAGIYVDDAEPATLAAGIRRALDLSRDEDARQRARTHVLERFPLERREEGIRAAVAGPAPGR